MATQTSRYTGSLANQYRAALNSRRGTGVKGGVDYSALIGDAPVAAPTPLAQPQEKLTGVRKILDVFSQPLYATAETGKETVGDIVKAFNGGSPLDILKGVALAAPRFLGNFGTGNDKKTWSDVLRGDVDYINDFNKLAGIDKRVTEETGPLAVRDNPLEGGVTHADIGEVPLKFAAGLAADIAGDPTSYIGVGLIKNVAALPAKIVKSTSVGRAAIDSAKGTKLGQDLARISKKAKAADVAPEQLDEAIEAGQTKANVELARVGAAQEEARPFAAGLVDEAPSPVPVADEVIPPVTPQAAPFSAAAIPENLDQVVREGRPARMLLDQLTGNTAPRTSNLARQLIRDPQYSDDVIQRLRDKPLIRDVELTPMQKAEAHAREVLARQEPEVPVPATSPEFSFTDYVKQVAATTGQSGERAKRFIAYMTKKARGGNLTPTEAKALQNLGSELEKGFKKVSKDQAGRGAVRPSEGLGARLAVTGPVAPESPGARQAVGDAAASSLRQSRAQTASARRLSGKALESWIAKSEASGISMAHMAELLAAKTPKEYNAIIGKMARAKTDGVPRHMEFAMSIYRHGNEIELPPNMSVETFEEIRQTPLGQAIENTTPVRQMVAQGTAPDPEALARIARGENMDQSLLGVIRVAAEKQGWKGVDEQFPHLSRTGTQRTDPTLGVGFGRNVAYNANMQQEIFAQLLAKHADEIARIREAEKTRSVSRTAANAEGKVVNTKWKVRANEQILNLILKDLRDIDDFMFANGVYGVATSSKEGVPLYLSQMFDALLQSTEGRNMLLGRVVDLWGFQAKPIKPGINKITGTTAKTSMTGTADIDSLMKLAGRIAKLAESPSAAGIQKFQKEFPNFAEEFGKILRGWHVGPQGESMRGITSGPNRTAVTEAQAAQVTNEVVAAFNNPATLARLFEHINQNSAKAIIRFGDEVQSVAQNTVQQILRTLDDSTGLVNNADKVESILHPERVANTFTNADEVADVAGDAARTQISEVVPEIDIKNAQHAETAFRHGDEAATAVHQNGANKQGQRLYEDNASASLRETPPEQLLDEDTVIDVAMQTNIGRALDFLGRKFVAHYGNATVHEAITSMGSVGGVLSRTYARELTHADSLAKKIATARGIANHRDVAKEAWDVIRAGNYDEVGPELTELVGQLRNLTDVIFATPRGAGKADSLLSTFFRDGFDIQHINMKMDQTRFGLPEKARFVTTVTEKGKKPRPATINELSNQWKGWDISDPIDFLHRMERVTAELATESAISREFYRLASVRGLASTKPRPGFIGATRKSLGDESILRYLPKSDNGVTYIHKDLIPEIKRMDDLLERVNHHNPELQNFLRNNVDPILAMWKSGMTIWRPGHHFRNVIGDLGMAFLVSGLKNPKYYARAVKMIGAKQNALGRTLRGDYGSWDAMAAMQGLHRAAEGGAFNRELSEEILGMAGDAPLSVAARTKINGKPVDISSQDLFNGLMNRGVLPDFRRQEDIIDLAGNSQAINKRIAQRVGFEGSAAQKGFQTAHNKLANFTEARDDFIRLSHAMHLIENGIDGKKAWKSVEEMYDQVAARIRKTHPDGTDLTPFEKNVMRRVFPFYSWTRKAIPLVFENTLTHPGRFLVYPKAMYNFGESMGVDLESLSEPFPEDQVFPNFITDKMTGIGWESADGHYWSFDAGVPQADVLNEFIGNGTLKDVSGGIAGMLNPAIKVPFELASGNQLNGQLPITDKSDYIDQQIPGVNTINSIFGLSPSSVVENLGQGTLGVDPTRQVERGNRGGLSENPEYALNYLFGQRLLDTSKPNYINLGRIQQIDRMNQLKEQSASN